MSYKRVVLKLSGEALAGELGHGLDDDVIAGICKSIKKIHENNIEVAIVVGGGNFWRGKTSAKMDRSSSDAIGMLGTVMNALRIQAGLEDIGIDTRVQTAISMQEIAEPFIRRKAVRHLEKGRIVIFAAGTGLPFFSTDTTAALRAAEIGADVILLAKKGVDGIYDSDPKINPNAVKFEKLSYLEILQKDLKVMDATATSLCMENNIPLVVFNMDDIDNIEKAATGNVNGTIVRGKNND